MVRDVDMNVSLRSYLKYYENMATRSYNYDIEIIKSILKTDNDINYNNSLAFSKICKNSNNSSIELKKILLLLIENGYNYKKYYNDYLWNNFIEKEIMEKYKELGYARFKIWLEML